MAQLKTEGIFIRMSPKLRKLFLALKDHKGMSQTNLIEYLVRSEADKCGVVAKEETEKKE